MGSTPAGVDRDLGTGFVVACPVTMAEAAGSAVGTGVRRTQHPHGRVLPCALSCHQAGGRAPQGEGPLARGDCKELDVTESMHAHTHIHTLNTFIVTRSLVSD